MQSRYKLADVENLKNELKLLPDAERESREIRLKDAMKVLVPVLKEMRDRRGYTNEQLLRLLHDKGIRIAKSSLNEYLRTRRRPASGGHEAESSAAAGPAPDQNSNATGHLPTPPVQTIKEPAIAPAKRPSVPPALPAQTPSAATLPRSSSA